MPQCFDLDGWARASQEEITGMGMAYGISKAKLRLIERCFPKASEAQVETLEILMDVDQLTTLLGSLEDKRNGRLVTMEDAFGDLSP